MDAMGKLYIFVKVNHISYMAVIHGVKVNSIKLASGGQRALAVFYNKNRFVVTLVTSYNFDKLPYADVKQAKIALRMTVCDFSVLVVMPLSPSVYAHTRSFESRYN